MKFDARAGEDHFMKVKGLITDFDEKTSKATEKKVDVEPDVAKHSSKLETGVAQSTSLEGEIAALQCEHGASSKSQLKMDIMRVFTTPWFAARATS